jgi:hypothetical protein
MNATAAAADPAAYVRITNLSKRFGEFTARPLGDDWLLEGRVER